MIAVLPFERGKSFFKGFFLFSKGFRKLQHQAKTSYTLGVSSDMVLTDVLETGYTVKNSMLNEKLEKLVPEDRNRIYEVIDTLVKQSKQILP